MLWSFITKMKEFQDLILVIISKKFNRSCPNSDYKECIPTQAYEQKTLAEGRLATDGGSPGDLARADSDISPLGLKLTLT